MMWPGGLPLWMEPIAEYIMQLLKEPGYSPQPCLPPPRPRPLPHPLTALAAAFPWNILSFLGLELYTFNSARVSLGNFRTHPKQCCTTSVKVQNFVFMMHLSLHITTTCFLVCPINCTASSSSEWPRTGTAGTEHITGPMSE